MAKETDDKPVEDSVDAKPARLATKKGFAHKLYTGEMSYDFVGHRKTWYIVSAVILIVCVASIVFRGLNLSIEFRGGGEFTVSTQATDESVTKVRESVLALGLPGMSDVPVNKIGDHSIRVQTRSLEVDEISKVKGAIASAVGVSPDEVAYSLIGASWGQQITNQGLIALIVFLVLVALLIWVYFREVKMSIAALVALLHDLIVTVGVFALLGFTVTPASLIGVLTILGYSLYDTVVVFDKVRENTADLKNTNHTYSEAANMAVNQVLVRSINTTIIGVLPVAALLFTGIFILGTGPLKDVGLALFVGMLAGAYSSIFIATPLLAQMKEAEPGMVEQRARIKRRADKAAAKQKLAVTVAADDAIGSPTDLHVRTRKPSDKKS